MSTPRNSIPLFAFLPASLFASLLLTSCGEKEIEVVRPFRAPYAAFQKQLAEMAAQNPKAAVHPPAPLSPKPELRGVMTAEASRTNTAIFLFQQLTDVRYSLYPKLDPLDLSLASRVITQLRVATAPYEQIDKKASVKLKQDLTDALATRYIGAVKIVSHQPGQMMGTEGFKEGQIQALVMLFDRETTKLVFADMVTAKNDASIDVTFLKGKPLTQESGQSWVNSNLKKNFHYAVMAKFAEGTGGVFDAPQSLF
jgi:hypothetical protein